jgi:guanylate kinase
VLYNSRDPRPGELDGRDYHFRRREEIEGFRDCEDFEVMDVRGDLQALDTGELKGDLEKGDVLFEGNPFVGSMLLSAHGLEGVDRVSVFMSPLSGEEIEYLKAPERNTDLPAFVTDVMRRKLLRRTKRQKTNLSLPDLENIENRASSAYSELKLAHLFDHVIVNHDGEDSENWDAFYHPIGDARRALVMFVSLLRGHPSQRLESWDTNLVP